MVRDSRGQKSRRSRSRSEERSKKFKSTSRRERSPSREHRRSRSRSPAESHRKKCKRKDREAGRDESRRSSSPPAPRRREASREPDHSRNDHRSKADESPRDKPNRSRHDAGRRSPNRRPDHHKKKEKEVWGKPDEEKDKKKPFVENIAKPDFGLSGKLAEETNTYKGVVIKYSQPPEARIPKRRWRLYPFKGDEVLPTLYIHRQSAYLIGRERKIADFPVDHPSISKQHAVLQYRAVPYTKADGTKGMRIRPYIIDLNSANGTYVNNQRIEAQKYVELLERDVIKFAYSSREYVLLHEESQDDAGDDDVSAVPSPNNSTETPV